MRWLFSFLVCLSSTVGFAQSSNYTVADPGDQFYQAEQFSKALLWYSAAVARDSTDWRSTLMIGESLRKLFKYEAALPYYRRVYKNAARRFPEAEFYYALTLKQLKRCQEALPLFERIISAYEDTTPLVKQARIEQQGCYELTYDFVDTSTTVLKQLPYPINTSAHDFAAVPYQNDSNLVLTSGRWRAPAKKIDYRYGENYTNLILVDRRKGQWREMNRELARLNTNEHDGPGCFNNTRTQFYFTRCSDNYCHIYLSELHEGKWKKPVKLKSPVNASQSNNKHPALSARDDTLFFSSDRAGGYGGTDLWMCVKDQDGEWGNAINLGETINTSSDEISPFYYGLEDLFFYASRGIGGGGMDIYGISHFVERRALQFPIRLPYPFNSVRDDGFLAIGRKQCFLASNRTGDFDIYQFTSDTTIALATQLLGAPPLSTNLQDVPLTIPSDRVLKLEIPIHDQANDIVVVHSGPEERLANGSSRFILNSDVSDIALKKLQKPLDTQKANLLSSDTSSTNAVSYGTGNTSLATLSTDVIPNTRKGEVMGSLFRSDAQEQVPLARTEVHLLDSAGQVVKITTTNELGRFHFVNLNSQIDYSIALTNQGTSSSAEYSVQDLVVKEYGESVTTVPYEVLYFDFNQSALRPEAQQALKDLADYFQQNPQTAIEINAYADSLGNDAYNLLLSQQRGESVFNFLLGQGVDPSALVINAQGISTSLSSSNSFVSQQLNRRVEIQLIGKNVNYYPRAETRILRPNVDLSQLYQLEGLNSKDLERLNGWEVKRATPLKPLRIPVLENPALEQFFFHVN